MFVQFVETPAPVVAEKQPHERLGISLGAYNALLLVRDNLDSGRMKKALLRGYYRGGFDMSSWNASVVGFPRVFGRCNSCMCIGGSIEHILGRAMSGPDRGAMDELFYPYILGKQNWRAITPAEAVKAIDNYVGTGNPSWEAVAPHLSVWL